MVAIAAKFIILRECKGLSKALDNSVGNLEHLNIADYCASAAICLFCRVFCVKFSCDASYIISGSDDTNLRLWKAKASEQLGVVSTSQIVPC